MDLKDIINAKPCRVCGGHGHINVYADSTSDLELEQQCIHCGGSGRTYIASNAIELLAKRLQMLEQGESKDG